MANFICTRHNMTMMTAAICIERQTLLVECEKILSQPGRYLKGHHAKNYNGFKFKCGGCRQGLERYEQHLKEEKSTMKNESTLTVPMGTKGLRPGSPSTEPEKTCEDCGKSLPRDREHFDFAAGSADKLTKACTVCRKKAKAGAGDKPADVKKSLTAETDKKPVQDKPGMVKKSRITKTNSVASTEHEPAKKPAKTESEPGKKNTCSQCKKSFPATPDFFHQVAKNTANGGLDYLCKTCKNAQKRKNKKRRDGHGMITLDLNPFPDLLQALEERAAEELRTPENQAIMELKRVFGQGLDVNSHGVEEITGMLRELTNSTRTLKVEGVV